MPGPLDGHRILVTGAGSGIGRALAIEASKRGASLCLCGRRSEPLFETRAQLDPRSAHLIVAADIASETGRVRVADHIAASWGALDLLVNNAGVIKAGRLEDMGADEIVEMMATNITGPILLTRELMGLLTMGRAPRIVNVGSMLGEIPFSNFAAYSASKAAMKGFSVAMRRELMVRNIGVTYATPRTTATQSVAQHATGGKVDSPERVAARIWGGVQRQQDHVYPSMTERLFMLLQMVAPKTVDRAVTTIVNSVASMPPNTQQKKRSEVQSHARH
ncbi:SDR family NAD(P)-dependent oxidoreductase (plasmid) [Rhizobium ruizarguesonis]|uniref:Ketoreductase domain-containing protein n=2 Tax=Rhizobium TaxID=379 RepID=A0A179C246_RHILE|nr:SDR family NAD(P)-dependent oxidoreductase [Rhizobium leguminosarum]OAP97548.1 hypothetical protein A4U53_36690 [Rhizobium leguminosarum]